MKQKIYILAALMLLCIAAIQAQTTLTGPVGSGDFGSRITVLTNGNYVVTDLSWDNGAIVDVGAVYLYDGSTHALISTLTGSRANDQVGSRGITALSNGNYVVSIPSWDNGVIVNVGAVTWASGTTGLSGLVSASNSLVGSTAGDAVGSGGITALSNGNYVASSPNWDNGTATNAGAVTLCSGITGVFGVVSASNSLVGSISNNQVGNIRVIALSNGNYVVSSPKWDNGTATDVGAVTWGSGTTGVFGVVSASNSLVGSTSNDQVGNGGITALSNGNYVVRSPFWTNGTATNAGAVTWGSGITGVSGVVSASNSLVDSTAYVRLGWGGITALSNGNYLVSSPFWANGTATNAGAVTWGSGTNGVSGVVSASNSLVGSKASDKVGSEGIIALSNGNYVVRSPFWDNGIATDAGAVTWASGTTGVSGVVSASNSLVGSTAGDAVGNGGITALSNGNYLVSIPNWGNASILNVGALTWGSGTTGVSGMVSTSNSLVGSSFNDQVGSTGSVTVLSNGNYVVSSLIWDNLTATDAGAVTWGSGTTGVSGIVSSSNSLVGSRVNDRVGSGGITALSNGNYVVSSPTWENGTATDAGAVTWCFGSTGVSGVVSASNSLVGSTAFDQVGSWDITALSNGNYVVSIPSWDNGVIVNVGAVTWASGTTGLSGLVSASNSLVGSTAGDAVGSGGITALSNGNYVASSPNWDNGTATNAGAVTLCSGITGVFGVVSASNSLVGSISNNQVGNIRVIALSNGNYVVSSPKWDNGTATDVGAVTWGSGTTGVFGVVSASNSLVGSTSNDQVGNGGITALSNGNYVVRSPFWTNGTATNAGAVTWGSGITGVSGVVSASNSLVDSTAYVRLGWGGITALSNGNYLVSSPFWANGTATNAGAVTWGSGTNGVSGVVSASNSLVGSKASDKVGSEGIIALSNGNYVVRSPFWDNGIATDAGAVTWASGTTGVSGVVSASNSLVGSTANELVNSVTPLSNGNYVVSSPSWDNGTATDAGAVTWGSGITGVSGVVSASNSLVGSFLGDWMGDITALSNGNYFVVSLQRTNGVVNGSKVLTLGSGSTGTTGFINSCNSQFGARSYSDVRVAFNNTYSYTLVGRPQENKVVVFIPFETVLSSHLDSLTQTLNGLTPRAFINNTCEILVTVLPNGTSPINGTVTAKTWIQIMHQPSGVSTTFVKRHYEITPTLNAATATGRVTLYFTQQEFKDFNAANIGDLDLPTSSTDASGKANLRIEKRLGTSSDGTGLPTTYTGTAETIDPADNDIVWNATSSRWEVSFDVTGFGGFFVKTITGILPLRWLNVNGNLNTQKQAVINWQVQETNAANYMVEKSTDGSIFATVGNLSSKGNGENIYSFTDAQAINAVAYYRVKQIDADGRFSYSAIIKLSNYQIGSLSIYPNPAKDIFTLSVDKTLLNSNAIIINATGATVQQVKITQLQTQINIGTLPSGMYMIKTLNGATQKIIKE